VVCWKISERMSEAGWANLNGSWTPGYAVIRCADPACASNRRRAFCIFDDFVTSQEGSIGKGMAQSNRFKGTSFRCLIRWFNSFLPVTKHLPWDRFMLWDWWADKNWTCLHGKVILSHPCSMSYVPFRGWENAAAVVRGSSKLNRLCGEDFCNIKIHYQIANNNATLNLNQRDSIWDSWKYQRHWFKLRVLLFR